MPFWRILPIILTYHIKWNTVYSMKSVTDLFLTWSHKPCIVTSLNNLLCNSSEILLDVFPGNAYRLIQFLNPSLPCLVAMAAKSSSLILQLQILIFIDLRWTPHLTLSLGSLSPVSWHEDCESITTHITGYLSDLSPLITGLAGMTQVQGIGLLSTGGFVRRILRASVELRRMNTFLHIVLLKAVVLKHNWNGGRNYALSWQFLSEAPERPDMGLHTPGLHPALFHHRAN